jgi:hypothetical protein
MRSQTSYQTTNYELPFRHPTYLTSFPTLSASNWLIFMFYTSNVISTCSQLIFFLLHIKCHFDIQPIFISYTSNVISTDKPTHLHYLHTNYHFNHPTHLQCQHIKCHFNMQPTHLHFLYIKWHSTSNQPFSIPHTLNGISLTYKQPIFHMEHVVKLCPWL